MIDGVGLSAAYLGSGSPVYKDGSAGPAHRSAPERRPRARSLPGFNLYGHRIHQPVVEAVFRRIPSVLDCALATRGTARRRHLVLFLVIDPATTMADLEVPLQSYAHRFLKAWQRPKVYAQTNLIPRDSNGEIRRLNLRTGPVEGRVFRKPPKPGRGTPASIVVREPVNEFQFEGVLRWNPELVEKGGAGRKYVLRLACTPHGGKEVVQSFVIKRKLQDALKLRRGDRVIVVGRFTGVSAPGRSVEVERVERVTTIKRVALKETEGVLERLL